MPGRRLLPLVALLLLLLAPACTALKRLAYEGFGRDRWQQPAEVIRALELQPGDQVADIGSGSGYFTRHLAAAVGPDGTVFAVDIDAAMNEYLIERARREGYQNVDVILADPDDPRLPESGVDLIFTSNTYHHLRDRIAYFANARRYLHDTGRVAIVDFDGRKWLYRWLGHWTPRDVVLQEMETAGYRLVAEFDFLDRQHFLVFSPNW